jgi:hypothetical protein
VNRFGVAHYSLIDAEGSGLPGEVAVPVIDGTPLYVRFGDVFFGVDLDLVVPPGHQWSGEPSYVEYGRAVVLDGTCGVAGCCGVIAEITIGSDSVTWSNIYCHAGNVDIPADLEFTFDRASYEQAIRDVADTPPQTMSLDDWNA